MGRRTESAHSFRQHSACQEHEFAPIETGAVALDVITCSPAGDATNIVGGIADALEDKPIRAHRTSIDHLSDLATVWLYQTTPAWAHLEQARIDALTAWYWTRQRVRRLVFARLGYHAAGPRIRRPAPRSLRVVA